VKVKLARKSANNHSWKPITENGFCNVGCILATKRQMSS